MKINVMQKQTKIADETPNPKDIKPTCGLISPISRIEELGPEHWVNVREIITEALNESFTVKLVSEAEDTGVIQGRIVTNVHDSDVVICDVSCKNPNVMFELGMRLAFDKPTVLIIDDGTSYIFDTNPIEHIQYPRDLRYNDIVNFKKELAAKVSATYLNFKKNGNKSFLDHFGKFDVHSLPNIQGDIYDYMKTEFDKINSKIQVNQNENIRKSNHEKVPIKTVDKLIKDLALNYFSDLKYFDLTGDARISVISEDIQAVLRSTYSIDAPLEFIKEKVDLAYVFS